MTWCFCFDRILKPLGLIGLKKKDLKQMFLDEGAQMFFSLKLSLTNEAAQLFYEKVGFIQIIQSL